MISTPIVLTSMAEILPQGTVFPVIPKSVHFRGDKAPKLPLQAGKWWKIPACSLVSGFKDVYFQHCSTHRNGTMIPNDFPFFSGAQPLEAMVQGLHPWIAHGPKGLLPCRKVNVWHLNGMWITPDFDSPRGRFNCWKYCMVSIFVAGDHYVGPWKIIKQHLWIQVDMTDQNPVVRWFSDHSGALCGCSSFIVWRVLFFWGLPFFGTLSNCHLQHIRCWRLAHSPATATCGSCTATCCQGHIT